MFVTVDDLEQEVEDLGEHRDIAGNLLSQMRKEGRWNPLRPAYAADYIINHERIEEKGKWSTEGKIVDRLAEMQWKSDIARFEEAQDIRQAEGKELLSKPLHLKQRKVFQTQHEMYKEQWQAQSRMLRDEVMHLDK